jgi:hypothetical protein
MTRNEARSQEDMNPQPGLDIPLAELNLGTVDKDGVITGPDSPQAGSLPADTIPGGAGPAPAALLEPFLLDVAERIRIHAAGSSKNENGHRRTEQFARIALVPIIDAFALAGEPFDVPGFIAEALREVDAEDETEAAPVTAPADLLVTTPEGEERS